MNNTPLTLFNFNSSKTLFREIENSNSPETIIRSLPAQTLFHLIREKGLNACCDIILMATVEQCRTVLDFDLWDKDTLNETTFWEWLSLTDENSDLEILQKFLKTVDLKLIALILDKYVDVQINEEATDQQPGFGFVSPDRGRTWIRVNIEDGTKYFLLNRLLALIFETSGEMFYQLLSIRNITTASILEEDSFLEKVSRLGAEGIPDYDFSAELNRGASLEELLKEDNSTSTTNILNFKGKNSIVLNLDGSLKPVENQTVNPLFSLFQEVTDQEVFIAELNLLSNSAIVLFNLDFRDKEVISKTVQQVHSAICIGIKEAEKSNLHPTLELYNKFSLQGFYKIGIYKLLEFRKFAKKIEGTIPNPSPKIIEALRCLKSNLPQLPAWLYLKNSVPESSSEEYDTIEYSYNCSLEDYQKIIEIIQKEV